MMNAPHIDRLLPRMLINIPDITYPMMLDELSNTNVVYISVGNYFA